MTIILKKKKTRLVHCYCPPISNTNRGAFQLITKSYPPASAVIRWSTAPTMNKSTINPSYPLVISQFAMEISHLGYLNHRTFHGPWLRVRSATNYRRVYGLWSCMQSWESTHHGNVNPCENELTPIPHDVRAISHSC